MKEICRRTLERVYLFLDGEVLSDEEKTQIETHLHECGPCYEHYGLDSDTVVLIARLRGSCRCPEGLKSRISALLDEV